MSKSILRLVLVLVTAMLTVSCTHKELCYDHDHTQTLRIKYDWRDAPDASPAGMVVWFYPVDGKGNVLRFDVKGTQGREVKVPPGKYNIISYNNDTELSHFDGIDKFDTHHIYTREGSILEPAADRRSPRFDDVPRPDGTYDQRVVVSPDEVWGCKALEVEVTEQGVSYLCFPFEENDDWYGRQPLVTEHVITLYPHDMLCHYSYEVRNVTNLESVTNMCGVLTGMSPIIYLHNETPGEECVSIPLTAYKSDDTTIRGEFLTFGYHADSTAPQRFGLYLWLKGGRSLFYGKDDGSFNVSSQIRGAPNPRRVHFIIDGLDLPPLVSEDGWNVSFDDWNEINTDIDI